MKSKRVLAAFIAAVMALTSFVTAMPVLAETNSSSTTHEKIQLVEFGKSEAEPQPVGRNVALDEALNWHGTCLNYETGLDYPFVPGSALGFNGAVAGNTGVNGSTSYLTAHYRTGEQRFNGSNNAEFSFAVYYSTEEEHDWFVFYINGEEEFRLSGEETMDSSGWRYYSTTLENDTDYTFTWSYEKDGSGSAGADMVCVRDVTVSRLVIDALARAVNAPGCSLIYKDVYNSWKPVVSEDGRLCAAPDMEYWYSSLGFTAYAQLNAGDVFSFDYYCDFTPEAEAAGGMNLTVKAGYTTVLTVESDTGGWQHFTYTLPQSLSPDQLSWSYRKADVPDTDTSTVLIDNVDLTRANTVSLDETLNAANSDLHFTSDCEYPFTHCYYYSPIYAPYAVSGNSGVDNSESVLHTDVEMMAGDVLLFEYYISSEQNDYFMLFINGEDFMCESGWQGECFTTVGIRALQSGTFGVDWIYVKDGAVSLGSDGMRLRNVQLYHPMENAANAPGNNMEYFTTEEYPFYAHQLDDGRLVAESYWNLRDNDVSALATIIDMKVGETLSFEYWLDCVPDADYFLFGVNGSLAYSDSGSMLGWKSCTFTAPADGEYLFEWVYQRGDSYTADYNCLRIDNVDYSGSSAALPGDVNGDGFVNANDALLVLRSALGIAPALGQEADVNGDGFVNANDALLILRAALGLAQL